MTHSRKPLAMALGAAFLASSVAPVASAASDPFSAETLRGGYDQANYADHEGKCGEGKCGEAGGEKKDAEGKCGEGKCGEASGEKDAEGKCGEGKCGDAGGEKDAEGKCGEGKCGGA
ncbi:HvfA family oxazolone/thioamide-modified RiPP metallophore [Haliea atlantica]|nr:hypothetical protein [Haliea sp.]